jgi:hypothetical protein
MHHQSSSDVKPISRTVTAVAPTNELLFSEGPNTQPQQLELT